MVDAASQWVARPAGAVVAGHRFGRYEVLTTIASGGMATVFAARVVGAGGFERVVALKWLHPHLAREPEFVEMFLEEAKLVAQIHHPNVVPTFDVGGDETEGFYLVMDYIEGGHLLGLLREANRTGRKLPTAHVLRIVIDALTGLGAAHALCAKDGRPLGLIHRDVSPSNLLVGTDGITRLGDFGIAKARGRMTSTRTGMLKGKINYMSPEQVNGCVLDHRADLFAMAAVLWEGLARRRLFDADDPPVVLQALLRRDFPQLSELDPRLAPFDSVLERALAYDPDHRFQSAAQFIDALEAVAPEVSGVAPHRAVAKQVARLAEGELSERSAAIARASERLNTQRPAPPRSWTAPKSHAGQTLGGGPVGTPSQPVSAPQPPVSSWVAPRPPASATPAQPGSNQPGPPQPTAVDPVPLASTVPPAAPLPRLELTALDAPPVPASRRRPETLQGYVPPGQSFRPRSRSDAVLRGLDAPGRSASTGEVLGRVFWWTVAIVFVLAAAFAVRSLLAGRRAIVIPDAAEFGAVETGHRPRARDATLRGQLSQTCEVSRYEMGSQSRALMASPGEPREGGECNMVEPGGIEHVAEGGRRGPPYPS